MYLEFVVSGACCRSSCWRLKGRSLSVPRLWKGRAGRAVTGAGKGPRTRSRGSAGASGRRVRHCADILVLKVAAFWSSKHFVFKELLSVFLKGKVSEKFAAGMLRRIEWWLCCHFFDSSALSKAWFFHREMARRMVSRECINLINFGRC